MKVETKEELIAYLKLEEAKSWETYQSFEDYCKSQYVNEPNQDNWKIHHVRLLTTYGSEWMQSKKILDDLDIDPYTFCERGELINKGLL